LQKVSKFAHHNLGILLNDWQIQGTVSAVSLEGLPEILAQISGRRFDTLLFMTTVQKNGQFGRSWLVPGSTDGWPSGLLQCAVLRRT